MTLLFKYLSYFIGIISKFEKPAFLAKLAVKIYANYYKANIEEASLGLSEYKNVSSFFRRDLKPGVRPISDGVVSPADAVLRDHGQVLGYAIPQVKDKSYFLNEFLGEVSNRDNLEDLYYANFYLSPKDYHHVHVPYNSTLKSIDYIPGHLWPVNDWSLNNVSNLFSQNERVIFTFDSELGVYYLVMIAATNVGDIRLSFDSDVFRKMYALPWHRKEVFSKQYSIEMKKGDRLASFLLGSSVVLLFKKDVVSNWSADANFGASIKYGESLFKPS